MKLLVVGGAGYVGSSVSAFLRDQGHGLWFLDDLSTGHRLYAHLARGLTIARAGNREALRDLFRRESFDGVLHFAASTLVGESVRLRDQYFENNVVQTQVLIEEMLQAGIRNFIFSSTCAVFGDPGEQRMNELLPKRPINPYGETKLEAERIIEGFTKTQGLRAIALRYFNAAGAEPKLRVGEAHEPETHLIPNIFRAVRAGRPVEMFGADYPTSDGSCIRDYVHVTDLAAAHEAALLRLFSGVQRPGFEAFNLGSENGYSVREVIQACERVLGRTIALRVADRRPGDPARLVADSALARETLGFRIQFPLEKIIETAWAWEKKKETPQPAVFLDRDGTLNEDPGYLNHPAQLKLLPGVGEALASLQNAGFRLVVVSNQSGVGRGLIPPEVLPLIHARMDELLRAYSVKLDRYECCLHHPDADCDCRKPKAKLVHDAAVALNLDVARSFFVGDKISDVGAGRQARCQASLLVRTGTGSEEEKKLRPGEADGVLDDLAAAARWIIQAARGTKAP